MWVSLGLEGVIRSLKRKIRRDGFRTSVINVAFTSLYISEWLMRNNNEYSWVWASLERLWWYVEGPYAFVYVWEQVCVCVFWNKTGVQQVNTKTSYTNAKNMFVSALQNYRKPSPLSTTRCLRRPWTIGSSSWTKIKTVCTWAAKTMYSQWTSTTSARPRWR